MNLKRVLSNLFILIMIFSLGVCANAGGDLEISYLNADNSAIHIEFSDGVKVTDLEDYLTILKDNEPITYTVKETASGTVGNAVYENGASAEDNAAVYDDGVTYTVIPNDGITFGTIYVIKIAKELEAYDGSLRVGNEIKRAIKVTEIFTEDFSKIYTGGSYINNRGSYTINTGEAVLTPPASGWMTLAVHPYAGSEYIGNSQTMTLRQYVDAYKYGNGEYSDITVSAKVKTGDSSTGGFELVTGMQTNTPHSFDYTYQPQHTIMEIDNGANEVTLISRYGKTNDSADPNNTSKEQVSYTKAFDDVSNNISSDSYCEVKLSSLNGKIKGYVNNRNVMSLKNATDEANGIFALRASTSEYFVDDICLTKMEAVEVKALEFKGIEASAHDIVVEFSAKVNIDVLKSAVTLKENGVPVDNIIVEDLSEGESYKYRVIPESGIALDVDYVLEIAEGLEASDGITTPLASFVSESFVASLPEITIDYFNADASAITLEFSEKLDFEQLNSAITLKNAGVVQKFDLYDATVTPTESSGVSDSVTYQIVPKEGMKIDSSYTLELKKGIMSEDGVTSVLKKDTVKCFKVKKLLYEGFDYSTTELARKVWISKSNKDEISNGEYKYTVGDPYQAYILIHPYGDGIIGDSKYKANSFLKTFMQTQKDYTVQADFKIGNAQISSSAGLLALHKGIPEGNSGEYNSFDYRIRYGVVHDLANSGNGIKSTIRTYSRPDDGNDEWSANEPERVLNSGYAKSANVGLSDSEYKTVRLSVRDGYFKGYFGYLNTSSYYDELLKPATGSVGFVFAGGAAGQVYYIDNLYVTRMVEVNPVESSIPSGTEEVEFNPEIVLNAGSLDSTTVTTSTIKVKTDSGNLGTSDYAVTYESNGNITVTFKNDLTPNTRYYIDLDGVKLAGAETASVFETVSFKTKPLDFLIDSFTVKNASGNDGFAEGEVTISATVKNNYLVAPQSFVMSICVYNEDNRLIGVKTGKHTLNKGEEADDNLVLNLNSGSYKAKCFVWSDFKSMTETLEEKIIE